MPAQVIGIAADEFLRLEDAVRPVTLYPVENRHVTDMLILHLDNEKLIYNGEMYETLEGRSVIGKLLLQMKQAE